MREFSEVLKELRNNKGISQEALGNIVHVSRSAIAKYENGLGIPSEDVIVALCNYFNVDKDYLFPKSRIEEVVVSKNKTIKKYKYYIIGLIILVCTLLISLLVNFFTNMYIEHKEKEDLINEIQKENEIVPALELKYVSSNLDRRIDGHENDNDIYLKDNMYIVYNELPFEIEFEVEPALYNCLDKNGTVKFNISDHYIDVKLTNSYFSNGNYTIIYTGIFNYDGSTELICDLYIEDFIYYYSLREYTNEEIKINSFSKNAFVDNEHNVIKVKFKYVQLVNITIKFYNHTIDNLYLKPGFKVKDIIGNGDNGYGLYLKEKVNNYKEKINNDYSIEFENKIEWNTNDNISIYSVRCDDFILTATSKILSNNVSISMLENTIQTCYPSGGYSVNNPICNKLTIYEGSTLNYILLNNEYYEISSDEVKIISSNDNVLVENKRIIGNKPGNVIVEYNIDLGFAKNTFTIEVEVLPYAKISLMFTSYYTNFVPYEDTNVDFYNNEIKEGLLKKFQNEIPNIFYEKTGFTAEVIDVYRFRNNEFYPILKTEFKYKSLEVKVNGQDLGNDILVKIGDRINIEYFISDNEKPGDFVIRHSTISGKDIFDKNGFVIKKGNAKRVGIITFGSIPYPVIIEYNVTVI